MSDPGHEGAVRARSERLETGFSGSTIRPGKPHLDQLVIVQRAHGLGGSASVLPVGASTAVPAQQPAPAAPVNPDAAALARYEDLQSRGAHMMAAAHLSSHGAAIARAKASRPS